MREFIDRLKRELQTPPDEIHHPPHYTQSQATCQCGQQIECIQITRWQTFNVGNAMKYLWRHKHKNQPIQDLEKAVWYIQDEIKRLKETIETPNAPRNGRSTDSISKGCHTNRGRWAEDKGDCS